MKRTILAAVAVGFLFVSAGGDARVSPKRARAARLATISYTVPGTVQPLRQPTSNTCWATVATMMYGWRNNASYDIPYVIGQTGSAYLSKFNNDVGLAGGDKPGFLNRMSLRSEAPMSYSITGWEHLLRQYGPLWVTTAEGAGFSIHARIIVGIDGDGTAAGTTFRIVDPGDGQVHTETIATFITKFEAVAKIDLGAGGDLRPQVVHY